jgi:hypothetical protein
VRAELDFDDRLVAESEAQRMARQMEHAVRQLCTAELERTRLRDLEGLAQTMYSSSGLGMRWCPRRSCRAFKT